MRENEVIFPRNINDVMNENIFSKMENFARIAADKNALKIFLYIAKNNVRSIDQIFEDTSLDLKEIVLSLEKLERGDFIVRNPGPRSQKFRLGFNGQLFAEQLRFSYEEVDNYLGNRKIIEPLKI